MTDIRTLLHEAAPKPLAPLDMAAIRERACRRSHRRTVVWIAGLGALVGLGIPAGNAILVTAGTGDRGAVVDASPAPGQDGTAERADTSGDGRVALEDTSMRTSPVLRRSSPPAGSAAPDTSDGPASSTPASAESTSGAESTTYPLARSCSVDNVGLVPGDERRCRFTAITSGGWNYYQPPNHLPGVDNPPTVTVRVERGGRPSTYHQTRMVQDGPAGGYRIEGCADDIIQPGDRVEVTITEPPRSWMDLDVRTEMGGGAGEHWGCTDSGP